MAIQLTVWTATMSTDDAEQQHRDEIMSISVFFAIGILLLVAVCVIWSKHHPRTAIPPVVPHRDPQRHHNLPVTLHAGLTKVEIALIPTFAYKSPTTAVNSLGSPAVLQDCVVCLSPVAEGEMVRQLLACNHLFHVECVDMWLFSNPTCPLCRTDAKAPAAEPSPSPELIQNSPSLAV